MLFAAIYFNHVYDVCCYSVHTRDAACAYWGVGEGAGTVGAPTPLAPPCNDAAAPNLQTSYFKCIYNITQKKLKITWQKKIETYECYRIYENFIIVCIKLDSDTLDR